MSSLSRRLSFLVLCAALVGATLLMGCGPKGGHGAPMSAARPDKAAAPLESVLPFWGHRGEVEKLAFSPDGRLLYSVAPREEVIVWNMSTGQPVRKLHGDVGSRVTGLIVSSKGDYVAVADERYINFWSSRNGMLQRTIELPPSDRPDEDEVEITAAVAADNTDYILVGDSLGRLVVLSIEQGTAVTTYRTPLGPITSVGAGNTWAAVSDGRNSMVLDLQKGAVPLPVLGNLEGLGLSALARYEDGLIGNDGVSIILWGPDFTDNPRALKGGDGADFMAVDVTNKRAVTGVASTGELVGWDLKKKRQEERSFLAGVAPRAAALDSTGSVLATAEQGKIVVRSLGDGVPSMTFVQAIIPHFLMFEPGTHRFLVAGTDGRPLRYDLDDPLEWDPFRQLSGPIVDGALDIAANGFYATTEGGEIVVFDYSAGRIAKTLEPDVGVRPHLALAGSRIALVSEQRGLVDTKGKGDLVVWDLNKEEAIARLNVTDAIDVEFAPAGVKVYYAAKSTLIESWNFEDQTRKKVFDDLSERANCLRMAPGGTMFALGGDGGVTFFNPSLSPLATAALPEVIDVAFANDGTRAVAVSADHSVYVVYFEGERVRTAPVVRAPTAVTSLAISSDNRFLLIGEERGTVDVFDLRKEEAKPLVTLQFLGGDHWVVFTPDGRYAGAPGDLVRFDVDGEIVKRIGGEYVWRRDDTGITSALR